MLESYLKLADQLTSIKKEIDEATFELDKKAVTRYKTFIPDEVKTLVVDDKWMTSIEKSIKTEMDRVSQGLTQRIKELAERYELPLPNLNDEVFNLEKKIMVHLSKMGFRMAVTKPYVKSGPNGFPTGWNVKELGDIADRIVGGGTPSRSNKDYWGHEIPWATVKDFTTFDSVKTQEYITHEGLKNSSSNLIPKGKIIIPTRMALGKAVLFDVDVAINQDLKALFLKDDADTKFVFYWLQSKSKFIEDLGSGSTVKGVSLNDLRKVKIGIPKSVKEQTAIATALSDADALITSLEKLIAKKRNIKQGAMQELLKPKKGWVVKTYNEVFNFLSTANYSRAELSEVG